MVGLAQLRLDANITKAPTILNLFARTDHLPQGVSTWDESFLRALYSSDQVSVLQVSKIETSMYEQVTGQ
jgi:hypothetical protein